MAASNLARILVIEDDTTLRSNVVELLSEEGFDVACAENGSDGLALAKRTRPDLIVCDIKMPGLDGYQVLEGVRSHAPTRSVPFIFLSAKAERQDIRQGMDRGADDYVSKPFELGELLAAVRARLSRANAWEGRSSAGPEPAPVVPLAAEAMEGAPASGIVVCDPEMRRLYGELERAAQSNISVLLLGETGAGKTCWRRRCTRVRAGTRGRS